MKKLLSLLLLIYPLILHLAIASQHLRWGLIYLAVILGWLSLNSWFSTAASVRRKSYLPYVYFALAALILWASSGSAELVAKSIPLAIYFALFTLVSSSLLAGHTPLITRLAALMRGQAAAELHPSVQHYTRRVTQFWAVFFLTLALLSLVLGLYAPLNWWSLFTNIYSYILIGLMGLIEFAVRRHRLADQMDYSFADFIQGLAKVDYKKVFGKSK